MQPPRMQDMDPSDRYLLVRQLKNKGYNNKPRTQDNLEKKSGEKEHSRWSVFSVTSRPSTSISVGCDVCLRAERAEGNHCQQLL